MRASPLLAAALCAIVACVAQAAGYDTVRIVAPSQDETVHDNRGKVTVSVAVSPPLRAGAGDRIALLLDGRVVAKGSDERIALSGVDRGTHALRAEVTASDGSVLIVSAPVTFHMWRASRLFPGRAP